MSQLTEEDFEYRPLDIDTPVMDRLRAAARKAIDMEQVITDMEEQTRRLKSDLQKVKNIDIPDLMAQVQQNDFTTTDGWKVEIQNFVSGTLPKEPDRRRMAMEWLENNGAADIIKTEIRVTFDKEERELAQSVMRLLEGYNEATLDPEMSSSIHPQTLLAHARERLRKGEEIPTFLGLFAGRVAKITPPKGRK